MGEHWSCPIHDLGPHCRGDSGQKVKPQAQCHFWVAMPGSKEKEELKMGRSPGAGRKGSWKQALPLHASPRTPSLGSTCVLSIQARSGFSHPLHHFSPKP